MKLVLTQAIIIFIAYLTIGKNTEQITIFILAVLIISVISLCLIGVFFYMYIVKPVESLMQCINMLKSEENQCIELFEKQRKEILKDTKRLVEVDKTIEEIICKERKIKKMEFETLQESIKPHFLYNALSSIAAIALENSMKNHTLLCSWFYKGF